MRDTCKTLEDNKLSMIDHAVYPIKFFGTD